MGHENGWIWKKCKIAAFVVICFRIFNQIIIPEMQMNFQEEQEQVVQIGEPEVPQKSITIPTYATQTLSPPNFTTDNFTTFMKSSKIPKTSVDISFEEEIFKGNAEVLRSGVIEYFKESLGEKFDEFHRIFLRNILNSKQNTEEDEQEPIIELITSKNKLLSVETQKKLFNYVHQFQQLSSLFKQLPPLMGNAITHEFAFIMFHILSLKAQSFKKLEESQILDLIPHIERFWGDQDKIELFQGGWEVYQDIDYAKIKKFALEKIEELASKLYYAPELRYLNLSQIQIANSCMSDKFCALVCLFAETLFLTMSEMRQQKQDLTEFVQQLKLQISSGETQFKHPAKHVKLE